MMIWENSNVVSSQPACLDCLANLIPSLPRVCAHSPHLKTRTKRVLFLVSAQSDVAVVFNDCVCQATKSVDEAWTKCRNSTDLDWTRAFAHDGRDPRSWPQTKPCRGQQVLEQSYAANQHGTWISCTTCALRLHHVPRHSARMTSVPTPSSASVQEALLKRMSLLRDNGFTAKAAKTNDLRSRGTEASKDESSTTNDDSVHHSEQQIQKQHPVRRSAR